MKGHWPALIGLGIVGLFLYGALARQSTPMPGSGAILPQNAVEINEYVTTSGQEIKIYQRGDMFYSRLNDKVFGPMTRSSMLQWLINERAT